MRIAINSPLVRTALVLFLCVSLGIIFFPTFKSIAEICWLYEDYSHGLLLPPITAYLIWTRRGEIISRAAANPADKRGFSWLGAILYSVGLLIYFIGEAGDSFYSSWIAVFPIILGALLLLFGAPVVSVISGPLLINFMAKPLPDSLLPKLFNPFQTMAASISAWVLEILGVPVYSMGNVIEIPGMRLMVEQACSGMRSLVSLLTVAFIVICLMELSLAGSAAMILAAVITAVALNVLRVALTGVLAYFVSPAAATGFFHTFAGMIIFIVGLAVLSAVGRLVEKRLGRVK